MKNFMAIYIGTEAARRESGWDALTEEERGGRQRKGMEAWRDWMENHRDSIVDAGGPLGKTKRVAKHGIADGRNDIVGYVIVRADSHEEAARLFSEHPHFSVFPGDSVEIMECLPMPGG